MCGSLSSGGWGKELHDHGLRSGCSSCSGEVAENVKATNSFRILLNLANGMLSSTLKSSFFFFWKISNEGLYFISQNCSGSLSVWMNSPLSFASFLYECSITTLMAFLGAHQLHDGYVSDYSGFLSFYFILDIRNVENVVSGIRSLLGEWIF